MKIVIIDERRGNLLTNEAVDACEGADIIGYINPDSTVRVDGPNLSKLSLGSSNGNGVTVDGFVTIDVFDAEHRDEVSARGSEMARVQREAERERGYEMSVEDKTRNAMEAIQSGNSGTEKITDS